jgi:hypothetical protein
MSKETKIEKIQAGITCLVLANEETSRVEPVAVNISRYHLSLFAQLGAKCQAPTPYHNVMMRYGWVYDDSLAGYLLPLDVLP